MQPKSINESRLKKKTDIVFGVLITCLFVTFVTSILLMVERTNLFLNDFVSLKQVVSVGAVLSVLTLILFANCLDKFFFATRDARRKFIRIFQVPPDGVYNSVEDSVRDTLRGLFLKAITELTVLKNVQKMHKIFESDRTKEKLNIALVQFGETRAMLREAAETASDWGLCVPCIIDYYLEAVNDKI